MGSAFTGPGGVSSDNAGYNILDYGGGGDGSVDNSPALEEILDVIPQTVPPRGAKITAPSGIYTFDTPVQGGGKFALHFQGDGGASSVESNGVGTHFVTGSASMEAILDFDGDGDGDLWHWGPTIDGINFQDVASPGTSGLVRINNTTRYKISDAAFRYAAEGLRLDRGAEDNAWGKLADCRWFECLIGLGLYGVNNLNVDGGEFTANRTGALLDNRTSGVNFDGTKADLSEEGDIGFHCFGFWNAFWGCKAEGWTTDDQTLFKMDYDVTGPPAGPSSGRENVLVAPVCFNTDNPGGKAIEIMAGCNGTGIVLPRMSGFTGAGGGGIIDGGTDTVIVGSGVYPPGSVTRAARLKELGIGSGVPHFGGGAGVLAMKNATTVPSTNPTGGGVFYIEAGALKYRGSSGTITTIANA